MTVSNHALLCVLILAGCATEGSPKVHGVEVEAGELPDSAPATDSGKPPGDAGAEVADGSVDAAPVADASPDAPDAQGCVSGTTVLLAGSGASLMGGGATGGKLPVAGAVTGTTIDRISIALSGGSFIAAIRASNNQLTSSTYTNVWLGAAPVPNAKAVIDAPALVTLGATAQLAYHNASFKFEHRQYANSAWDLADDPIGGTGNNQAFGPSAGAAAAIGAELEFMQSGDNFFLYDLALKNAVWQAPHQQVNASVEKALPPAMVALSGGTAEVLAVYLRRNDFKIMSVTRTSGTWDVNPVLVDVNAFSNDPLALTPMSAGRALLVYRGSNQQPYFSVFDPSKNPVWTPPAALFMANPTITSTPSLAAGLCADAAIVAYAKLSGGVEIARFDGTKFSAPDPVAGTSTATFVAIATKP